MIIPNNNTRWLTQEMDLKKEVPEDNSPTFVQLYTHNLAVYFYNRIKVLFLSPFLNLQAIKAIGHRYDNTVFPLIKP